MTSDDPSRRMDLARLRAELTIQDLWLRYVALGGTGDAFDLDAHLQGLVPLDSFQQDILAHALNEALEDIYRAYRIPLSTRPSGSKDDDQLRIAVEQLLQDRLPTLHRDPEPPGHALP